jgi:hypothetical protein
VTTAPSTSILSVASIPFCFAAALPTTTITTDANRTVRVLNQPTSTAITVASPAVGGEPTITVFRQQFSNIAGWDQYCSHVIYTPSSISQDLSFVPPCSSISVVDERPPFSLWYVHE